MYCGITLSSEIINYSDWKSKVQLDINTPVNLDTGELKYNKKVYKSINGKIVQYYQIINHTTSFKNYRILINEVIRAGVKTKFYITVKGSLHKSYFNGRNDKTFYLVNVKNEIDMLCNALKIDKSKTKIDSLEFGVNIELDYKPFNFLKKHLINYKCNSFNQYSSDNKNKTIGFVCERTQYHVKCYDKGLQFDLDKNLMRFELKFKKMQKLKNIGIMYLDDLLKSEIHLKLKELLIKAWNNILLSEPIQTENEVLTELQKTLLVKGDNTKYWYDLYVKDKRQLNYHRIVYKDLIIKYGTGYHKNILNKIENEWNEISSNVCTILPLR